jgi:very-short-patch-repair endonuclease
MAGITRHAGAIWALVHRQHGVIARRQLLALGFNKAAIEHRLATGRLHRTPFRGVYAVGRPDLSELGRWMAAVLSCGDGAYLSHHDAAALYRIRRPHNGPIHVTVTSSARSRPGVRVHRRPNLQPNETTTTNGIPTTTALATLIDLAAAGLSDRQLESVVNEADKLNLVQAHQVPALVDAVPTRRGTSRLRAITARHVRADTDLELAYLRILRTYGLPLPETQVRLEAGRVDFFWPELNLVVEVDGARYHRTPAQQAEDRRRDQEHAVAGRTTLRFADSHMDEPARVAATTRAVITRLSSPLAPAPSGPEGGARTTR